MTNANMKLVIVAVTFPDKLELSDAKLEEGEHIVKRIVELDKLHGVLQGQSAPYCSLFEMFDKELCILTTAYRVYK